MYNLVNFFVVYFSFIVFFDVVFRFLKDGIMFKYDSCFIEENFVFFGYSVS